MSESLCHAHAMSATLKIDFVSDIACPWCAVGLASLQQALAQQRRCGAGHAALPAL
jgi:predicted DsbA family dithiol-disulfide isomerase